MFKIHVCPACGQSVSPQRMEKIAEERLKEQRDAVPKEVDKGEGEESPDDLTARWTRNSFPSRTEGDI